MLIIRKSLIIILAAASGISMLVITAAAYLKILNAGQMTNSDLKYTAEVYLFGGIILVLLITAAFIFLIFKSRNISTEIERLIKQEKLNPASTKTGLLRLGSIGLKLNSLYKQIDEVSEMRGLKISALSKTSEFLALNVSKPIIIVDVTGMIIQISRGFLHDSEMSRNGILGRSVESIIPGIEMKKVLSRLEKKRLPTKIRISKTEYTWTPIHNKNNEISYIAVTQSEERPN